MGWCRNCNIEVLDETERCPLCGSVLEQTVEVENMYPDVRMMTRRLMLFSRIYLFCAIVAEAVLVAVNVIFDFQTWWSAITGLTLLYIYTLIRFAILGKSGYINKVIVLALVGILMVIASDFLSGYRGWSVNYALPASILVIDAGILVLMILNRRGWQSYIMLQIFMILCGFVPVALYFLGIVTVPVLAFLPLAVSSFLFLGTMIIGDRRARLELARRFHVR